MKTLKLVLSISLMFILSINVLAQEKELSAEQKTKMEAQLNEYFSKLDLTEDQKPKFEEITKRYGQEMMDLKSGSQSRMEKYKAYKAVKSNKDKEMKALLSEKQYDVYTQAQKDMKKKMKEKRKNKS
ncbi:MAG: hypothetical protein ACPG6V_08935 [Flavobacteriales bacterium]